jgi:hypothetical protein
MMQPVLGRGLGNFCIDFGYLDSPVYYTLLPMFHLQSKSIIEEAKDAKDAKNAATDTHGPNSAFDAIIVLVKPGM